MSILPLHASRLVTLVVASIALLAAMVPAHSAQAVGGPAPAWQAYGITVDFPNQQPRVIYTAYTGALLPEPTVVASSTLDISPQCIIDSPTGQLTYDGDYAIFDGQSSIRCRLPSWRGQIAALAPGLPAASQAVVTCQAGGGPFFVSADVKLDGKPSANPIIDARRLGWAFSLPNDGIRARTRVDLSSGSYVSPKWTASPLGNRMLMGMHGPATVAVANHFKWVDFLTAPTWENYFKNFVVGPRMGHWVEAPIAVRTQAVAPFALPTRGAVVHIGHNPTTGAYLNGKLRIVIGDPGCFSD